MNIKFTERMEAGSSGTITSVKQGSLDLCGQGRSRGEADIVLPIQLSGNTGAGAGSKPMIAPLVSVKTATTRNKKGTTSALLRVAMPYTAFREVQSYVADKDGTKVIKSELNQDASRSGGEFSMHLVVAMPSAMTTDLAKTGGTDSAHSIRRAAQEQLVALAMLLRSIAGKTLSPDVQQLVPNGTSGFNPRTVTDPGTKPGDGVGKELYIAREKPEEGFFAADIQGYGPGIDMSQTQQQVHLDDAFGRILRGQPALSCKDIEVPVTSV